MSSMKVVVTEMMRQNLIQEALERIAGDWQAALNGQEQSEAQQVPAGVEVDQNFENNLDVYAGYLSGDSAKTLELTREEQSSYRTHVAMKVDGKQLGLVGDIGIRRLSSGKFAFIYDIDNKNLKAFEEDLTGLYNVLEQIEDAKSSLGADIAAYPERRTAEVEECGGQSQWRAVVAVDRQQLIARQIVAR